jgi:hypothetical protein
MNKKTKSIIIICYIVLAIFSFITMLVVPSLNEVFKKLSSDIPYIMGFIKFSLLATAGELIAIAIATKEFNAPVKVVWRFIIWGFIGIWITFMMKVLSTAVSAMMTSGALLGGDSIFLKALYTSVIMNTTFGPTFMAVHKITDKFLELRAKKEKANLTNIVKNIDWCGFWNFTILKTVPLFWIPAHTITFLLPAEYQVMMAAALSVALGIILSLGNRNKKSKEN